MRSFERKKVRHCEQSEAIWELQSRSQSDRETLGHQIATSPSAPRNDGFFFVSRGAVVILTIFLCSSNLLAHPSLFFTQDEMNIIGKKDHKNNLLQNSLQLSSLLYIDDTHWAVWINGTCIRPDNVEAFEDMQIVEVKENHVKVRLKNSPETVTLRSLQTYKFQKVN